MSKEMVLLRAKRALEMDVDMRVTTEVANVERDSKDQITIYGTEKDGELWYVVLPQEVVEMIEETSLPAVDALMDSEGNPSAMAKEFEELEQWLSTLESEKPAALGKALFEYVEGNVCDVGWEGFTESELKGVRAFLKDFKIACENGLIQK